MEAFTEIYDPLTCQSLDVAQYYLGLEILNILLLECAAEGEEDGVRRALAMGANVNACDTAGRSALTCTLTTESWQTVHADQASFMTESRLSALRRIVSSRDISLYDLNAPQDALNGITPLGITAWLNMPTAVEVLLQASGGLVSVDAIDEHGATPLMYAARDGNLEVVQHLLVYGARADFGDVHHRTPIQYALSHPQVLWLCEGSLRTHRAQDDQNRNLHPSAQPNTDTLLGLIALSLPENEVLVPPPITYFCPKKIAKTTSSLVDAVISGDLPFIHSLLFPQPLSSRPLSPEPNSDPLLVNSPDSEGWSSIHYCVCVKRPSVKVLDALYRAGADVSLFTRLEQYTPLHCLARYSCNLVDDPMVASSLYSFALHLVRDLRSPLSARDRNEDTCIHAAAEHGERVEILLAFLDCDTNGLVRQLKNSRGLTALDVAKPRFRGAFGVVPDLSRPLSAASARTVRPSAVHSAQSSISSASIFSIEHVSHHSKSENFESTTDASTLSQTLLENLGFVSRNLREGCSQPRVDNLHGVLAETIEKSREVFSFYATRAEEALKELNAIQATYNTANSLLGNARLKVEQKQDLQSGQDDQEWHERDHSRRRTTDSGDSEQTAVSSGSANSEASSSFSRSVRSRGHADSEVGRYVDVGVSTTPTTLDIVDSGATLGPSGKRSIPWPTWLDSWIPNMDAALSKPHPIKSTEFDYDGAYQDSFDITSNDDLPSKRRRWAEALVKESEYDSGTVKANGNGTVKKDTGMSGAAKLKAWLKKKIKSDPHKSWKLEIVMDLEPDRCAVGRQAKGGFKSDSSMPISGHLPSYPSKELRDERTRPLGEGEWEQREGLNKRVLRKAGRILDTASADMASIADCMKTIEQYITSARRSISQAERTFNKAIKTRESTLQDVRTYREGKLANDDFNSTVSDVKTSTVRFSPSDIPSTASSSERASCISLSSTLIEGSGDDEDIRLLRRLLIRKIGARIDGAFDEIDKVGTWLRIVKEVLASLQRRTGI